jgi:hypothetical protein
LNRLALLNIRGVKQESFGITETGGVYYVMEDLLLTGYTADEALENLLIGRDVSPGS